MPIQNADIAGIFSRIADLLDIKGANPFRIRAYRNAARITGELSRGLPEMIEKGKDLSELPEIGQDLSGKIEEIVKTGSLQLLRDLAKEVPAELTEMLRIKGIGPRKVSALHKELGINSLDDLKKAAKDHTIREISGFGAKTERNITEALERYSGSEMRTRLSVADEIAAPLLDYLHKTEKVEQVEIAGSFRRRKETVGDLDILVVHSGDSDVMARISEYEDVDKVVAKGESRSAVLLRNGMQVDIRAVAAENFGAALQYFTGSKAHNIAVRKLARARKLKVNEYGVFKGKKRIAGKTEKEVYEQVGLPYIEPELRENLGEIEAASKGELPELITLDDIRGDLHSHTKRTDGHAGLEEMARAARNRGYEYLAITEHSKKVTVASGLDADELRDHIRAIERLNRNLDGILLLKGVEVDILEDGSLDLPDDVLAELDFTVCSVHSKFDLSREKQTERIIKAMDNPHFRILGHPSGLIINKRPPSDIDMEAVIKAAAEKGCFMELNAHPDRLDLNAVHCKFAKEHGVKIALSTDAHSTDNLEFMRFGIWQARRGWLEAGDVLNTRSWKELKKLFQRG